MTDHFEGTQSIIERSTKRRKVIHRMDVPSWARGVYRDKIYPRLPREQGIYVIDEKWDNLVILDACRYDAFREMNTIEGVLEARISRGSTSEEFLRENFVRHPTRTRFDDVVYVAANPLVSSFLKNRVGEIYPVWDYGWDDALNTVPPENVVNAAMDAMRKHPDKRTIIHFMQPHFPALTGKFSGETGFSGLRRVVKMDLDPVKVSQDQGELDVLVEALLKKGNLNRTQVWSAYRENLKIVLSYAAKLVENLTGRTVITSDHGETFGERPSISYPFRVFGHPENLHVRPLVLVPWLIIDKPISKTSQSNETRDFSYAKEDDEKIQDRLRKLGYL
jgi:hypothetical protein